MRNTGTTKKASIDPSLQLVDTHRAEIHSFLLDVTPAVVTLYGVCSSSVKRGFEPFVQLLVCGHDENTGELLDQVISDYSGDSILSVTVVVDLPGDLIHEHQASSGLSRLQLLKTYFRNLRLLPSIQRMHHGGYPHRVKIPLCGQGTELIQVLTSLFHSDALSIDSTANRWLGELRLYALGSEFSSLSWYPWLVHHQEGQCSRFHVRAIYPASLLLGQLLSNSLGLSREPVLVFHDAINHSRHSLFLQRQLLFTRLIERPTEDLPEQLDQLWKTLDYLQSEGLIESLSGTEITVIGVSNSLLTSRISSNFSSKVGRIKVLDSDNTLPLRGLLMKTEPIEALALPSVRHRSFKNYFAGIKQSRVLQRINCLSERLRVELRQHNRVNLLLVSTFVGSVLLFFSSLFLIVEIITTGYEIRHLESEMGVGLIRENELLEETVLHQHDAFMMRDVIAVSESLDDLSINPLDVVLKIASTLNRSEYVSLSSLNWKNVGDDWPKNNEQGTAPDSSRSRSSSMLKRILSDDDPLPRGQLSLVNAKSSAEGLFLVWLEAVLVGPCESVPDCYSLYSQFLVQLRSIEKFSSVVEIDKPFTASGKSTFVGDRYRGDTANQEDPFSEALLTDENADARRFRILLVVEK